LVEKVPVSVPPPLTVTPDRVNTKSAEAVRAVES
jgi:hypothetical protein